MVAECPALPGCLSQGTDEQAAFANIKEANTAWLWAEDQKVQSSSTAYLGVIVVQSGSSNAPVSERVLVSALKVSAKHWSELGKR